MSIRGPQCPHEEVLDSNASVAAHDDAPILSGRAAVERRIHVDQGGRLAQPPPLVGVPLVPRATLALSGASTARPRVAITQELKHISLILMMRRLSPLLFSLEFVSKLIEPFPSARP